MDELWWYLRGLAPLFFLKKGVDPIINEASLKREVFLFPGISRDPYGFLQ